MRNMRRKRCLQDAAGTCNQELLETDAKRPSERARATEKASLVAGTYRANRVVMMRSSCGSKMRLLEPARPPPSAARAAAVTLKCASLQPSSSAAMRRSALDATSAAAAWLVSDCCSAASSDWNRATRSAQAVPALLSDASSGARLAGGTPAAPQSSHWLLHRLLVSADQAQERQMRNCAVMPSGVAAPYHACTGLLAIQTSSQTMCSPDSSA